MELATTMTGREHSVEQARKMLRIATARRKPPFGDLCSDPAWLILLNLFVREYDGLRTCISDACIASMSTQPTALRYIEVLARRGMIRKRVDPADQERVYLFLSGGAKEELAALLESDAG